MEYPERTFKLQKNETVDIGFVRDPDTRWYVDFPEYPGHRADLEMVEGADIFLETIGKGDSTLTLEVCLQEFEGSMLVEVVDDELAGEVECGRNYRIEKLDLDMWLCPVMLYTFGGYYPEKFYVKK